jgi:hypothetical protein
MQTLGGLQWSFMGNESQRVVLTECNQRFCIPNIREEELEAREGVNAVKARRLLRMSQIISLTPDKIVDGLQRNV